jgi:hypothetical protein
MSEARDCECEYIHWRVSYHSRLYQQGPFPSGSRRQEAMQRALQYLIKHSPAYQGATISQQHLDFYLGPHGDPDTPVELPDSAFSLFDAKERGAAHGPRAARSAAAQVAGEG